MKKSILIICLSMLAFSGRLFSQHGWATVVNHTDFAIDVTLYGYAPISCDIGACNTTYITNVISIPYTTGFPISSGTWGAYDPCAVTTGIGWATNLCSTDFCGHNPPSDFNWTKAEVTVYSSDWGSIYPIHVGDLAIRCDGVSTVISATYTCSSCSSYPNLNVSWTSPGGSLADVIVRVDQY
jgi:hypothetical protein